MHCERRTLPDVIESTEPPSTYRRGEGRSVKTLATMLTVLILLSSAFVLLSSVAVGASPEGADPATGQALRPVTRLAWDWEGMASDSGFVSVILTVPGAKDASAGLSHVLAALGTYGIGTAPGDGNGDEVGQALTHLFGSTLGGVSAYMYPSTLETFLADNPSVEAYPDLPVQAMMGESILDVGADEIWSRTDPYGASVTGTGILVSVIDTGIDYTHPDLGDGFGPSYKVIGGYDFYNHDDDPMDDNGHGTHVAGIIAADGELVGMAPDALLLAYKALGPDGSGSMSDVIAAIDASIDPDGDGDPADRADVISMSLGGQGEVGDPVCMAVERAVEAGIVVVVAAGNSGPSMNTVASPGVSPSAITVGAVNDEGELAGFSSRGPTPDMTVKPDLSAPGVGIVSTVPYDGAEMSSYTGYMAMSGTSMATPHVSGAAALLLQLHPDWTVQEVKSALVSGASEIDESVWAAGSGELWLPASADTELFFSQPIVSYGLADGVPEEVTITNAGPSVSVSISSSDWFSLYADGAVAPVEMTDASSVSPTTTSISAGGTACVTLTAEVAEDDPEGYYEGEISISGSSGGMRIPFGFVVLSRLTVHVTNMHGEEVFDPYGGVWVYDIPDGDIAMGARGNIEPAPPATFFLPSGEYSVHSIGHQLIYTYSDPYILSSTVTLDRVESLDLYLQMTDANIVTLDLETDDGVPIYVKDYRAYCRHEGTTNISFDLVGSDYSVVGSDMFSVKRSVDLYISDTDAEVGVSIAGFSYSEAMWTFMELNWDHWHEYTSGMSTDFMIEASADQQYLLAWEFHGVDSSLPGVLGLDPERTSVYVTKYDIPGEILNPWCDWGTHRSIGGDAAFYVRRDTDTSLNPFFSGMTRTTFVQGVFSELYYPSSIFEGFVERQFYEADYSYMLDAMTLSIIKVPDRNYLTELPATYEEQTIGAGPYYPALFMQNSDDMLVLYQPLLRDQSGAKVGGVMNPSMSLYRGGALVGVYSLSEYLARPDAVRMVNLAGDGTYVANITYLPTSQVTDDVVIELGFTVPSADADPPRIAGMEMSQRFVPGEGIDIVLETEDSSGDIVTEILWRANGAGEWYPLSVTETTPCVFQATIPTTSSDASVDLRLRLTDPSGNYILATMTNAALAEIPVTFELYPMDSEVSYRTLPDVVVLEGQLVDGAGDPLSGDAGVPLELMIDGEKVGMILDEYVTSWSHFHDGSIRFEWYVNPLDLFTAPGQSVEVSVEFDLGVYQPHTCTFSLESVEYDNTPPIIDLVSPANMSMIAPGTTIDLDIIDEGVFIAEAYLDGELLGTLEDPYDVETDAWPDGYHTLTIVAIDDVLAESTASYTFQVDGTAPHVAILYPMDGSTVPRDGTLVIEASDDHLYVVIMSVDDGPDQLLMPPFEVDMTGWTVGTHTVEVTATDKAGLSSSATSTFEISERTVIINIASPEDGAVVNSGTDVEFYVLGEGTIECSWTVGDGWYGISEPYAISTSGWDEGDYDITINATNDLGGFDEISVELTIDDTAPEVTLLSPDEESFVTPDDIISVRVDDDNLDHVEWNLWGETGTSLDPEVSIRLLDSPADGYFTVTVTGHDLAGNIASDEYTFAMDSQPPAITVDSVAPGGAVAAGGTIEFSVTDPYLALVECALDNDDMAVVHSPYAYDLGDASLGWHTLHISASDLTGRAAWLNQSLYVDGVSPTVDVETEEAYPSGEAAEITAVVADDYGVGYVVLYYEAEDGSYTSVEMTGDGGTYTVLLDADLLRDGMSVYVCVYDDAGNLGESEVVTLSVVAGVEDGIPGTDDDPETDPEGGVSMLTVAAVGGVAAVALVAMLFLYDGGRLVGRENGRAPRANAGTKTAPRPPTSAPRTSNRPAVGTTQVRNGVVYCKPVKVNAGKVVKRPPMNGGNGARNGPKRD